MHQLPRKTKTRSFTIHHLQHKDEAWQSHHHHLLHWIGRKQQISMGKWNCYLESRQEEWSWKTLGAASRVRSMQASNCFLSLWVHSPVCWSPQTSTSQDILHCASTWKNSQESSYISSSSQQQQQKQSVLRRLQAELIDNKQAIMHKC